jgi:hypothetical protein
MLKNIEAELSGENLDASEEQHLRRRAELIRLLLPVGPVT